MLRIFRIPAALLAAALAGAAALLAIDLTMLVEKGTWQPFRSDMRAAVSTLMLIAAGWGVLIYILAYLRDQRDQTAARLAALERSMANTQPLPTLRVVGTAAVQPEPVQLPSPDTVAAMRRLARKVNGEP